MDIALPAADVRLLDAALGLPAASVPSIAKVRYTHTDMIDFMIANPWISQNELAARYGYSPAWVSRILASDSFQMQLAARREEVVDPDLKATIEERFRSLTILSLQRLEQKLSAPQVSDNVALRAAELGAKALGVGGNAPPPPRNEGDHLAKLANRLLDLQSNIRKGVTYEGTAAAEGAENAEG